MHAGFYWFVVTDICDSGLNHMLCVFFLGIVSIFCQFVLKRTMPNTACLKEKQIE